MRKNNKYNILPFSLSWVIMWIKKIADWLGESPDKVQKNVLEDKQTEYDWQKRTEHYLPYRMAEKIVFGEATRQEIEDFHIRWDHIDKEAILEAIRADLDRLGSPQAVRDEKERSRQERGILPVNDLMDMFVNKAWQDSLYEKGKTKHRIWDVFNLFKKKKQSPVDVKSIVADILDKNPLQMH